MKKPTLQLSNSPTLQLSNSPTLQLSNSPTLQLSNSPTLQLSNSPKPKNNFLKGIFHRLKRFSLNNKNSLYLFFLAGSYSCKSKSSSSSSDVDTARVVVDNMLSITEDSTETRIRVVANNNNLFVSAVEEAENGEVSVDNGYILYTPNANFEGSETLRYSISDSNGDTSTAELIVTVTGINDPAVITGDTTASITEGDAGRIFGTLSSIDIDNDNTGGISTVVIRKLSDYGSYNILSDRWLYSLDTSHSTVQALKDGETLIDTFSLFTDDGTEQVITITIHGENEPPIFSGDSTGIVAENGILSATGALDYTDIDRDISDLWQAQTSQSSSYGTYSINVSGNWSYNLDNSHTAVQGLNGGESLTDTFTVLTEDGTEQVIAITINGDSGSAIISGDMTGVIAEDGIVSVTGDLDYTAELWQVETSQSSDYGTYSINTSGNWTYNLNNNHIAVQGLGEGESFTDSFSVFSEDGTRQMVSITINGENDAVIITGETRIGITDTFIVLNGNLDYTDADNNDVEDVWQASDVFSNLNNIASITSEGRWSYSLRPNLRDSLIASSDGDVWDTFTVYTSDGTAQVITLVVERADEVTSTSFDDNNTDLELLSPLLVDVGSENIPIDYLDNMARGEELFFMTPDTHFDGDFLL